MGDEGESGSGGDSSPPFMDSMQSIGIVNAMKTGNMHVDMFIAMCIPVVLRVVFGWLGKFDTEEWIEKFNNYWFPEPVDTTVWHTRTITHVEEKDEYGDSYSLDEASQNEILIKAITMYLHHLKCMKPRHAHLKLQSGAGQSDYDDDIDDDGPDDGQYRWSKTLKSYKIVQNPPSDQWHPTGRKYSVKSLGLDNKKQPEEDQDDDCNEDETAETDALMNNNKDEEKPRTHHAVQIQITENEEKQQGGGVDANGKAIQPTGNNRHTKQYCLRSTCREAVDKFIKEAYIWYCNEIKKGEDKDKARYYYDLKDRDYGENQSHEYKRYKLSDDKSFNSMFFKERETIVRLLDHFLKKSGKYGIEGYPYKLGLLLHGPPGTGKTSLIKAIAQYTKRSIVNIPLARIKTNDELNRLFFSDELKFEGSYYPAKMSFKDVIYVMEDIDAASKVVQRRDGKRTSSVSQSVHVNMPLPKSMWQLLLESQGEKCIELVQKLVEQSDRLKESATSSESLTSLAQRMNSIPGLCVVGHTPTADQSSAGAATIKKIATDALEDGNQMMKGCKSLDEYLNFHATSILKLLEMGAKVDEAFENEIMGLSDEGNPDNNAATTTTTIPGKPQGLSRDVSYSQYGDHASLEVETIDKTAHALSRLAASGMGGSSGQMSGDNGSGGGGEMGMNFGGSLPFGGGGPDPWDMSAGMGGGVGGGGGGFGGGGKKGKKGGFGGGGFLGGFGGFGGFGPLRDELNLSGLLNVLDGVVDTPGRILVMTTNHPEKLDAALIRPGRIDKKLILSYMRAEDVVSMLEHYFQLELKGVQKLRVHDAIKGDGTPQRPALNLTPAQVEQLTVEHDDIEDMLAALEEKAKPIIVEKEAEMTTPAESCSRITFEGSSDW